MLADGKTRYPVPPGEGDPSWIPVRHFMGHFHASMFCYIPDAESLKHLPVIHSDVLDIQKQQEGYGIFYSVNGFKSSSKRTGDNLLSINAFYVDIDWPKERLGIPKPEDLTIFKRDALQDLSQAILDGFGPTHIIETKNGLHALWCLDEPIIIDNLPEDKQQSLIRTYQKILLALIDRFQGDPSAKDVERVLRLPNSWHLKNPADPFRVRFCDSNEPCQTYVFKQIKDYFLKKTDALPSDLTDGSGKISQNTVSDPSDSGISELIWKHTRNREPIDPGVFLELQARYPKTERPSIQALMAKSGIGEGRRNQSLLIAASAMRESGQSEAEVLSYFDTYNGLSAYEIAATIKSAFKTPSPMSFGWNNPLVMAEVTVAEKAKVSAVIGTILSEKQQSKLTKKKAEEIALQSKDVKPYVPTIVAMPEEQAAEIRANIKKRAENRAIAEYKTFQRKLFNSYEMVMHERFPRLKYCPDNSLFYDFNRGVYEEVSLEELKSRIVNEMEKDGLMDYRTETNVKNKVLCLKAISVVQINSNEIDPDPNILNLENGLLDFTTGDLKPHSADYFSTRRFPIVYRPGKELQTLCPRWLKFVSEIMQGDEGKARLLQQMAGYCFTRSVEHQKAFILYGTGANGKSTFLDVITKLMGTDNVSSLTLADLSKNFGTHRLLGKTMNIVEEISENFFESDMIKKIITGSEVTADRKFMDAVVFRPYAKFVFAVNALPKIRDTSTGLYRRFYIIDFDASFGEGSGDISLPNQLWSERDGIFLWCMKGWQDLVQNGTFLVPESVMQASERFKESNSPLVEFLLNHYDLTSLDRASAFMLPLLNVFDTYQGTLKDLGYQPKNFSNFCKELSNLNHKTLSGIKIVEMAGSKLVTGLKLKGQANIQPLTPSFQ